MRNPRRNRTAVKWGAITGVMLLILAGAGFAFNRTLSRIARDRAIRALQDNFSGQLELKNLSVTVFPCVHVAGEGLTLHYHGRRDLPPLVAVRRFSADGGLSALFTGQLGQARLEGLEIQIPPKSERRAGNKEGHPRSSPRFAIDEIDADAAVLRVLPSDPQKEPLVWEIRHLTVEKAGTSSPMPFRATLINAKPPGDIETRGKFGPWQTDEPRTTPVEGAYTFRNADLSVFKGISGILSSEGTYRGALERIEIQGDTDTPDFALRVSRNPFHLAAKFHAVVDGTDGNTLLEPVEARFRRSFVVARGTVNGTKGVKGRTISLNVAVNRGRLEDMLRLGVRGKPSMTGMISFRARLVIPPGDTDIANKMKLAGEFTADSAHFSSVDTQEKINRLSHRGEGDPKADPSDTVASDFSGRFKLDHGVANFDDLSFQVPGVRVALHGSYGLTDEELDFRGSAKLDAKLSQTTTGFKSFLLKAVDPFFKKKDAGAELPVKISGTRDQPAFGVAFRHSKRASR